MPLANENLLMASNSERSTEFYAPKKLDFSRLSNKKLTLVNQKENSAQSLL